MDRYLAGQVNNLTYEANMAKKKRENPLSLAVGTEIALTKHASATWKSWLTSDEALIVTNVSVDTGGLEYSVNGCSWFDHEDLKFVAEPTKKSVAYACQVGLGEDDDEEEDPKTGKPIKRKEIKLKRSEAAVKAMKNLKLKRH